MLNRWWAKPSKALVAKPASLTRRPKVRLTVEALEERAVPAVFSFFNTNDSGPGSFRQALLDANASPGTDDIEGNFFNPGQEVFTINVLSPLPDITEAVSIRPGFITANLSARIGLNGANAGAANGLVFRETSGSSSISEFNINRFQQNGILIEGGSHNEVTDCVITLNGLAGIEARGGASSNIFRDNVLSSNGTHGIILLDAGTDENTVTGNECNANVFQGIALFAGPANNDVLFNTASNNGSNGIFVGRSDNNVLQENLGTANGLHGICVTDEASGNLIDNNDIGNNNQDGILIGREPSFDPLGLVSAGDGNAVLGNAIFNNLGQGIDLGDNDGPSANDPFDLDKGPNDTQNAPASITVVPQGLHLYRVLGSLSSRRNTSYRIEVFTSSAADPEGQVLQTAFQVTTSDTGTATFAKTLAGSIPNGVKFTATATSIINGVFTDTSEFGGNTAPMIRNDTLTPQINEGQYAILSGNLVDPDAFDTLTLRVNWGDGAPVQDYHPGLDPFAVRHRYVDNGTYNVHFVWLDDQGNSNSRTRTVVVHNVAPELDHVRFLTLGHFAVIGGRISDPGADSFTLIVNWGDGQTNVHHYNRVGIPFVLAHQYEQTGTKHVKLTLQDDDGGEDIVELDLSIPRHGPSGASLTALLEYFAGEGRRRS